MPDDARLFAPSAARNRGPILQAIGPYLPPRGLILEVASGTGEHVAHFAAHHPELRWQPSDPAPERRESIGSWCRDLPNVAPALALDAAAAADWTGLRADVVLCINMVHISPWPATQGLFAGAARALEAPGWLALYGPFRRRGATLGPGNAAFDASLRERDPAWGLREVETVTALGEREGFAAPTIVTMPADNLTLLFRRM